MEEAPAEEVDASTLPPEVKTTKRGRQYIATNNYDTDDSRVWARSPRLKEALLSTGIEWSSLEPPESGANLVIGTTAAELAERRRRAEEHERMELMRRVLDRREEIKMDHAQKAAAAAKAAETGGGGGAGEDSSTVLQMAQEHMQRLMEASERRIADDRRRLAEAENLAQEKLKEQQRIDDELARRKVEQFEAVKKQRAANLQARLEREAKKEAADLQAIEDGRQLEAARVEKEEEVAVKLEKNKMQYSGNSLAFARKRAKKLNKIAEMHRAREQRAAEVAAATERKLAESEAKRTLAVEKRHAQVMAENKARNEENEKRRQAKVLEDAQRTREKADAIVKKLAEVDQRLLVKEEEAERRRKALQIQQVKDEQERASKLLAIQRSAGRAAADTVKNAELKDAALERAIKRKQHKLQLRAQDNSIRFDLKQHQVARMMKAKEYERSVREEDLNIKDAHIAEVNFEKKQFNEKRGRIAREFFVKKAMLKDAAERTAQRSPSAPPAGVTAASQRALAARLSAPLRGDFTNPQDANTLLFGPKSQSMLA